MMYAYSVPMESGRSLIVAVVALAVVMSGQRAHAQPSTAGPGGPGWVLSHQKISDTEGGGPRLVNRGIFPILKMSKRQTLVS